jgi:hypothetical protein
MVSEQTQDQSRVSKESRSSTNTESRVSVTRVVPLVSLIQSNGPKADCIGDPKGVILTNHNIIQAVISNGLGVTDGFTGEEEWRFLAFMPLSHM